MKVTLYESESVFSDLCDEWCRLLDDSVTDQIFLRCEWLRTWWEAYHPGQIWALVIREEESGQLVGVAPWYLHAEADGTRVINPIGCVDVTDYLDVIVRRGHEEAVYRAIAASLDDHRSAYDRVELCNFPEQSPSLTYLPAALEQRRFGVSVEVEDVCPVVKLPEEWVDYFALLDKKNRHELRRKLRKAGNHVEWYIVGPEHDLEAETERFLQLMAASSLEKEDFLQNPHHQAFFHALIPLMAERGWLQLAFLTVGGEAAAAYLNLVYNNQVLVYNSGHDPAAHGNLSPGIVLLGRLIEHAIEEGREMFDFLRGDEPYKYDMGGQNTNVFRMTIMPGAEG